MAFEILLTSSAERDILEVAEYVALDSREQASKWLVSFFEVIESLKDLHSRHTLIPESKALGRNLRSINHFSHRIIYEVNEETKKVSIIRVYHFARKPLKRKDV